MTARQDPAQPCVCSHAAGVHVPGNDGTRGSCTSCPGCYGFLPAPAPVVDTAMLRADISEWAKTEAEPLIRVARRLCDALDAARECLAYEREEVASLMGTQAPDPDHLRAVNFALGWGTSQISLVADALDAARAEAERWRLAWVSACRDRSKMRHELWALQGQLEGAQQLRDKAEADPAHSDGAQRAVRTALSSPAPTAAIPHEYVQPLHTAFHPALTPCAYMVSADSEPYRTCGHPATHHTATGRGTADQPAAHEVPHPFALDVETALRSIFCADCNGDEHDPIHTATAVREQALRDLFLADALTAARTADGAPEPAAVTTEPEPAAGPGSGICRSCGCTDETACFGGCHWVAPDLCSACGDGGPDA